MSCPYNQLKESLKIKILLTRIRVVPIIKSAGRSEKFNRKTVNVEPVPFRKLRKKFLSKPNLYRKVEKEKKPELKVHRAYLLRDISSESTFSNEKKNRKVNSKSLARTVDFA
jgi:hypothetical protein